MCPGSLPIQCLWTNSSKMDNDFGGAYIFFFETNMKEFECSAYYFVFLQFFAAIELFFNTRKWEGVRQMNQRLFCSIEAGGSKKTKGKKVT